MAVPLRQSMCFGLTGLWSRRSRISMPISYLRIFFSVWALRKGFWASCTKIILMRPWIPDTIRPWSFWNMTCSMERAWPWQAKRLMSRRRCRWNRRIRLTEIQETQNTVFALGGGFTQWSKILINGEPVETQWISETLLKAPDQRLEPTDQVTVGQVCENLTLLGQTAPGKEAVKL